MDDFLQKLKKLVRIVLYGLADQIAGKPVRISWHLIICSHWPIVRSIRENIWTAVLKYEPNEVRSIRKAKVQIFSRMDQTNCSIRALLYSHNQHLGFILDKIILNWIVMTIYTSNSLSSIFVRIFRNIFKFLWLIWRKAFIQKNKTCLKTSLSSILFVYWCKPSIFRSNTPFWRSNTAFDGPLINQSNPFFLSGYTIMFNTKNVLIKKFLQIRSLRIKKNYKKAIQFILSEIKNIPLEINRRYCRVSVTVLGKKNY